MFYAVNVKDQQLEELFLSEFWNTVVESLFLSSNVLSQKFQQKQGGTGSWVFDQANPIIRLNISEQSEGTMGVC